MNDYEKMQNGYLHNCAAPELLEQLHSCQQLCYELNQTAPLDSEKRQELLGKILQHEYEDLRITSPFYCDYGKHIKFGKRCFVNYGCVFLDEAIITFGDNVMIAPNCCITTVGHPLDAEQRNQALEIASPITIGDSVWIGASVTICPGVTIGSNTVIGAGSVVVKDIPSGVVAFGNPCRAIREITEEDKYKYPTCD